MASGCDETVLCSVVQHQLARLGEPNNDKYHLLRLIDEYKLFSYEKCAALEKVFKEVHSLLESPVHKWFGMLLLQRAACQCNTEILADYAKYWLEKTLSCLKPHQQIEVRMMGFHTFSIMMKHISDKKNLSKYFDTPFLNSFIHLCLSNITCCSEQAIQSLTYCIEKFPSAADLFKHQVGEDWISKLFHENISAKLIAELVSAVEHRSSVNPQFTDFQWEVMNIHYLLNYIVDEDDPDYQPLNIDNSMTTSLKSFSSSISDWEEPKRTNAIIYKIRFGLSCVENSINKPCLKSTDAVSFNVIEVLQLLHRMVDISTKKSSPSIRKELYISYQPTLICQGSALLTTIINRLRSQIAPFSNIISNLLIKFLQKTLSSKSGHSTTVAYFETKSQIYSCLTVYLQVMKSSVDRKGFTDQMINHILKDIAIEEATIKLTDTNKKGRITNDAQCNSNGDLAVKALIALRWLIITVGPRINAKSLNDIQAALIDCVETSFLQQPEQNISSSRRKEQFHSLMVLGTVRHAYYAPPVATIMSLLNRASNEDPDLMVSSYCLEAMSSFEFIAIACRAVMFQTVSVPAQSSKTPSSQPPTAMWMQHSASNISTQESRQQASFNEYPSVSNTRQQSQTVGEAAPLLSPVATEQPSFISVGTANHQDDNLQQNSLTFEGDLNTPQVVPCSTSTQQVSDMEAAPRDIAMDEGSEVASESNSAEAINSDSDIQFVESAGGEDSAEDDDNSIEEENEESKNTSQIDEMLKAFVEAPPDSD